MTQKVQSPFQLLMNKSIYAILDGDTKFEDYEFIDDCTTAKIAMPYLSGPDLCELSTLFGLPMTYTFRVYYELSVEFRLLMGNRGFDFAFLRMKADYLQRSLS